MKTSCKTYVPRDLVISDDTLQLLFSLVSDELIKNAELYEKLKGTICLPSSFFDKNFKLGVALDELEIYKETLKNYDKRTKK